MRTEQEIYDLLMNTAQDDERIRAVIMNGSRANPNAPRDIFQDFDIVYIVTETSSFKDDPNWPNRFGELMIMQMPDQMLDPPPSDDGRFAYLMQFTDGNRIDLTLYPRARLKELEADSLSIMLLDKDGILAPFAPPSESDYLPKPPSAKEFSDCCNEFWWVCPYVAKGLWREEIIYAKHMLDHVARTQLMKLLTWHVGVTSRFSRGPGKFGKYLERCLEPELWAILQRTYSDASYEDTWYALHEMCRLFGITARRVADHFGFEYPVSDDEKVSAHLKHVQSLSKDATEMY